MSTWAIILLVVLVVCVLAGGGSFIFIDFDGFDDD